MSPTWYGVKAIFRRDTTPGPPREAPLSAVEERIVLITAVDLDEAVSKGEAEARAYAETVRWPNDAGQDIVCRFLEGLEVFQISAEPGDGVEVFAKTLYVPRDETDARIVARMLGGEGEDGENVCGSFEPDFGRVRE